MEKILIRYPGNLITHATHQRSGVQLATAAPVDNQGDGSSFSPTDLAATSLGSCMMTIAAIAARNHGFGIDGSSVEVTKIMTSAPRRIQEIVLLFRFGPGPFSDKQKSILEHAVKHCPVALSLHPDLRQTIQFQWNHES